MVRKAPLIVSIAGGGTLSGTNIINVTSGSSVAVVSVSNTLEAGDVVVFTTLSNTSVGSGVHPLNKRLTVTSASSNRFEVALTSTAAATSAATGGTVVIAVEATTTSDWLPLDYQYAGDPVERGIFTILGSASNHSLKLQIAGSALSSAQDTITTYYDVSNYTAALGDSFLVGNWPAIRLISVATGDKVNKFIITQ